MPVIVVCYLNLPVHFLVMNMSKIVVLRLDYLFSGNRSLLSKAPFT